MPTKILAIDDSETMHRLFKMIFDDAEFELILSDNGEEGLEFVKKHKPDIILLDFIMPKVNGFQFCKIIRNELELDTPILLITSKAEDVGEKFTDRFANIDYIPKPFQPDEIIEKMEGMLGASQGYFSEDLKEQKEASEEELITEEKPEDTFTLEEERAKKDESEKTTEVGYDPDFTAAESSDLETKIMNAVKSHMRELIQRMIQLETGYQNAELKGENPDLQELTDIMRDGFGVLKVFNFEQTFSFYFKEEKLFFGWSNKGCIEQISDIFQHVTGVSLFKAESFAEIYDQLKAMDINDAQIQSTFGYYIYNLINSALNMENSRYFVKKTSDEKNAVDTVFISADNLQSGFSDYLEEKAEINKIIYDDNLIPQSVYQTEGKGNFSELERKIMDLCDGKRNVGQILKFFGNNIQMAKNSLGTLVLTGFIKI